MLRSGYSNATVMKELSARGFSEVFDSGAELQLTHSGANAEIIDALKSGRYRVAAVPHPASPRQPATNYETGAPALLARPPQQQQVESRPEAAQPAPQSRPPQTAPPQVHDSIYSRIQGDLVWLHQGSIVPFDDQPLETKKYYFLFFSANWNPAGRKFAGELVDYYQQAEPQHPEMEVIFFSADRSQFGMETLLTQTAMPWPAVAYDKLSGKAGDIQRALVKEIPALIFADAAGKILAYSRGGDNAVTMEQVLRQADQILNSSASTARR